MKQNEQYLEILDDAFGRHFPSWKEMSPFDPTKLLVEGFASSLATVENRQKKILEKVLDCLPSLFSMTPKSGRLPIGLFQLSASPKVNEAKTLGTDLLLKFQGPKQMYILKARRECRLLPISEFEVSTQTDTVVVRFRQQGATADLRLQFLPDEGVLPSKIQNVEVQIVRKGKKPETLNHDQLLFEETTDSFTQYGETSIHRLDRAPVFGETADVELRIRFDRLPHGRFAANALPFEFGLHSDGVELGFLVGEPWEEVALPANVHAAPTSVILHYPDGRQMALRGVGEEVLRTRLTSDVAKDMFFYHGTHHSIVIPDADFLIQNFNGGVAVKLGPTVVRPDAEWLSDDCKPILGEHAIVLDDMKPVRVLSVAVERESSDAYLSRFFSTWRQFQSSHGNPAGLFTRDLENDLLTSNPVLQTIEIETEECSNAVTVYVLAEDPASPNALRITAETAQILRRSLAEFMPLSFKYRLSPFKKSVVKLAFSVNLDIAEQRLNLVTAQAVEVLLLRSSERILLPPPFGSLGYGVVLEKAKVLTVAIGALEGLLHSGELKGIEVSITDENGVFLESIVRSPGQYLVTEVKARSRFATQLHRRLEVAR